MSAKLSRIAALMLFVWTPLPVRADKIDTEHLFAFTIGTDTGEVGEKEIEGQTDGRFGKRDGSYSALSQTLSAEFNPVQNFRMEVSGTSTRVMRCSLARPSTPSSLNAPGLPLAGAYRLRGNQWTIRVGSIS